MKLRRPFLNIPNFRRLMLKRIQDKGHGIDVNGYHPLLSEQPMQNIFESLHSLDDQIDHAIGLKPRE